MPDISFQTVVKNAFTVAVDVRVSLCREKYHVAINQTETRTFTSHNT